jgi:hypothetical protein
VTENKFYPWPKFLILPKEKREKFTYPKEWNISLVNKVSNENEQTKEKASNPIS